LIIFQELLTLTADSKLWPRLSAPRKEFQTQALSVATDAARFQDLSMNPQKLAGQCAKLKCCLNYEVDAYVEGRKQLPSPKEELQTQEHTYYLSKMDIFKKELTFSTDKNTPANLVTISADRAFEVINMNKNGEKPYSLLSDRDVKDEKRDTKDILDDSVSRFDKMKKKKKKKKQQNNLLNGKNNNPANDSNDNDYS